MYSILEEYNLCLESTNLLTIKRSKHAKIKEQLYVSFVFIISLLLCEKSFLRQIQGLNTFCTFINFNCNNYLKTLFNI